MSLYESLRHFADSWGLLGLTLFFLAVLVWTFRPGGRDVYARQAMIPFQNEAASKAGAAPRETRPQHGGTDNA